MEKRLFTLTLCWLGISLLMAYSAFAGEYHYGDSLECMQCHVMHHSQQHTYSGVLGSGSPTSTPRQATLGTVGPYGKLLRDQTSVVCLSCHSGQVSSIPDVLGTNTATHTRQAGGLTTNSTSYPAGIGYDEWDGHTLGIEIETGPVEHPPGCEDNDLCTNCHPGGGGYREPRLLPMQCSSCHNPHGTSSHRNLRDNYGALVTPVSYAVTSTPGNTTDVRIDLGAVPAVGDRISYGFYSRENIYFNNPSSGNSAYGDFCGICHGKFHGTGYTGADSPFDLHPTENVAFSDTGGLPPDTYEGQDYKVQVMMASNSDSVTDYLGGLPTCVSCHKAHGNQNAFGLLYMVQIGAAGHTEEGTTATSTNPSVPAEARDLCRTCHTQ